MGSRSRFALSWAWKALLGLVMLSTAYGLISPQLKLAQYKSLFGGIKHPSGTSQVDALALQIEYYAGDSVQFESYYFVGELRSYDAPWRQILLFYDNKSLQHACPRPAGILSLPIRFKDDHLSIDTDSGFASGFGYAFDPFTADMFSDVESHYEWWGVPNSLKGTDQRLYLVYCLWQTQ